VLECRQRCVGVMCHLLTQMSWWIRVLALRIHSGLRSRVPNLVLGERHPGLVRRLLEEDIVRGGIGGV
jgi:hypothetical protein